MRDSVASRARSLRSSVRDETEAARRAGTSRSRPPIPTTTERRGAVKRERDRSKERTVKATSTPDPPPKPPPERRHHDEDAKPKKHHDVEPLSASESEEPLERHSTPADRRREELRHTRQRLAHRRSQLQLSHRRSPSPVSGSDSSDRWSDNALLDSDLDHKPSRRELHERSIRIASDLSRAQHRAEQLRVGERRLREQLQLQSLANERAVTEAREERSAALRVARADAQALREEQRKQVEVVAQLEAQVAEARAISQTRADEVERLQRSLSACEMGRRAETTQAESELARLRAELSSLTEREASLARVASERSTLLEEEGKTRAAIEGRMQTLSGQVAELASRLDDCKSELDASCLAKDRVLGDLEREQLAHNAAEEKVRLINETLASERRSNENQQSALTQQLKEANERADASVAAAQIRANEVAEAIARAQEAEGALKEARSVSAGAQEEKLQAKAEAASLSTLLDDAKRQAEAKSSQVLKLEKDVESLKKDLDSSKQRMRTRSDEWTRTMESQDRAMKDLRRQHEELKASAESKLTLYNQQHELAIRAAADIKSVEARARDLMQQRESTRRHAAELEAEVTSLRDAAAREEKHRESYEAEIRGLEDQVTTLRSAFERDIDSVRGRSVEAERLMAVAREEKAACDGRLAEMQRQREETLGQIAQLEDTLQGLRDRFEQQIDDSRRESDAWRAQAVGLEGERDDAYDEIDGLRRTNSTYRRQLANLKSRSEALQSGYDEVQTHLEREVATHRERANAAEEQALHLKDELETAHQQSKEHASDVARMQDVVKELQGEFDGEIAMLQSQLKEKNREVGDAQILASKAQNEIDSLKHEHTQYGAEMAQFEADIQRLRSQYEANLADLEDKLSKEEAKSRDGSQKRDALEDDNRTLRRQMEAIRLEVKSLEAEIEALRTARTTEVQSAQMKMESSLVEETGRWRRRLERQSELLETREREFDNTIKTLEEKYSDAQNEADELRALYSREVTTLMDQVGRAEATVNQQTVELRSHCDQLERDVKQRDEELSVLRETVSGLQRELTRQRA